MTQRVYTKKEAAQNTAILSVSDIDKAAVWGDQLIPLSDNEYKDTIRGKGYMLKN